MLVIKGAVIASLKESFSTDVNRGNLAMFNNKIVTCPSETYRQIWMYVLHTSMTMTDSSTRKESCSDVGTYTS